ncbi:hypothetical protein MMC10_001623 [Thelotrema lepadinum]|nr:hypothetical protein [Thelotrema lepadinum]
MCSLKFGLQSDLSRHAATHYANNRFYVCEWDNCQHGGFTRKQHLERHIKGKHLKLGSQVEENREITGCMIKDLLKRSERNAKAREKQFSEQFSGIFAFVEAMNREDLDTMDRILTQGRVAINQEDGQGRTALHIAAQRGSRASTSFLLSRGADANSSTRHRDELLNIATVEGNDEALRAMLDFGIRDSGNSALYKACSLGQLKCVEVLLGYSIGVQERECLLLASSKKHLHIVQLFLEHGVRPEPEISSSLLYVAATEGRTRMLDLLLRHEEEYSVRHEELLQACEAGKFETAQLLLANDLLPHQPSVYKGSWTTPLLLAVKGDHIALATLLLDSGAAPKFKNSKIRSPLEEASSAGSFPLVKLFLQYINSVARVSTEKLSQDESNSALNAALQGDSLDMIRFWLEQGANVDLIGNGHRTPLMCAAMEGGAKRMQLLLQFSADIHYQNMFEKTALMLASECGRFETVRCLLEYGADPNYTDRYGTSALMFASKGGHETSVRSLLEHGANVFHTDLKGRTMLFYALQSRGDYSKRLATGNIKLFLACGIDINHTDNEGETALLTGITYGHEDSVQLLLEHGADIFHANNNGRAALHMAIYPDKTGCLQMLLNHCNRVNLNPQGELFQQLVEVTHRYHFEATKQMLLSYAESKEIVSA